MTVFIVDDSSITCNMLEKYIKRNRECELLIFTDPKVALAAYDIKKPKIIFLDDHMPVRK